MKTRLAILALALAITACGTPQIQYVVVTAIPAPTKAPTAAPTAIPQTYPEYQCGPVDLPTGMTSVRCFTINDATQMTGTMFYTGNRLMAIGTVGPLDASESDINASVDFVYGAAHAGGWNLDDLAAAGQAISEPGVPVIRGTVIAELFVEGDIVTVVYFLTETTVGVSA